MRVNMHREKILLSIIKTHLPIYFKYIEMSELLYAFANAE